MFIAVQPFKGLNDTGQLYNIAKYQTTRMIKLSLLLFIVIGS